MTPERIAELRARDARDESDNETNDIMREMLDAYEQAVAERDRYREALKRIDGLSTIETTEIASIARKALEGK